MEIVFLLVVLIFSVMLHEVAHGVVAGFFGDDTAAVMGRLTLNPLSHIDWVGSVVVPGGMALLGMPVFGWAKPVPINPLRFNAYRAGVICVSLAGPLTNIVLAFAMAAVLWGMLHFGIIQPGNNFLLALLAQGVLLNLVLAIFNLFPIPPLDGSRVVSMLLPVELSLKYDSLERYGFFILIGLMFLGILGRVLTPLVYGAYKLVMGIFGIYG